jgi:hypothetical protein
MEQKWFEMAEIRKRRFDSAVWIPLRANQKNETGRWGYLGYESEYFGAGSLAVPLRSARRLRSYAGQTLACFTITAVL